MEKMKKSEGNIKHVKIIGIHRDAMRELFIVLNRFHGHKQ